MSMINLDRQARALEEAYLYPEQRRSRGERAMAVADRPMTIALSRQPGTPADEIASEVSRQLGWPVHDRDILERIAHELGMPASAVERFDERRQSWLLECIEALSSGRGVAESVYVRHLLGVLRELSDAGNCVIVGRGAAYVLPGDSTVSVRLVGAREDRVRRMAERLGIDSYQASRLVDQVESERIRFARDYFNREPRDLSNYDLVLNTSHLDPVKCGGLIVEAVHLRQQAR